MELPDPAPGFRHSPELAGAVHLYPHRLRGEGHFIAVLRKQSSEDTPPEFQRASHTKFSAESVPPGWEEFLSFVQATLSANFLPTLPAPPHSSAVANSSAPHVSSTLPSPSAPTGSPALSAAPVPSGSNTSSLTYSSSSDPSTKPPEFLSPLQGSYLFFVRHLYLNPAPDVSLDGLNIVRPGLHLGEVKPGRFQPGQALAHALRPQDASSYLSFPPSGPRLQRYLHGESWTEPGPDGWLLIGVDEFPLGWAKRVAGQIKNHYPKELRTNH